MEFKPKARVSDLVIQNSGNELLIFDLKTNTALSLNETSARIWQSCDGKREAADIGSYLEESDGVYVDQDLVLLAIRQLSDSNLLAAKTPDSGNSERVSRRKLLRQIGAGSAVALPIIHSIVAPPASAAATPVDCTIPPGTVACTPGPTTSGTCGDPMLRCFDNVCINCVPLGCAAPFGQQNRCCINTAAGLTAPTCQGPLDNCICGSDPVLEVPMA